MYSELAIIIACEYTLKDNSYNNSISTRVSIWHYLQSQLLMHLKQNLDFGAGNGESVHIPLVNIRVHSEKIKKSNQPCHESPL